MKRATTKFRVLVIEDREDQWIIQEQAFRQVWPNVQLVRAASAAQAQLLLEEYEQQEWDFPQLIILDLYLPHRADGYSLLARIRGLVSPLNQVPVVVLSSSASQPDVLEAYQRGAGLYIIKPMGYDDWLTQFRILKSYWTETAELPSIKYKV